MSIEEGKAVLACFVVLVCIVVVFVMITEL